jgi:hypothetical protein
MGLTPEDDVVVMDRAVLPAGKRPRVTRLDSHDRSLPNGSGDIPERWPRRRFDR